MKLSGRSLGRHGFWSIFALTLVLGMSLFSRSASSQTYGGQWDARMKDFYHTLAELLTDVTSDRLFNDPANRSRIQDEAAKIAALSHDLARDSTQLSSNVDPSVQVLAGMLNEETHRAQTELARGNASYARTILRSIPSYCIACHTRNSSGPRFASLPLIPLGNLSSFERGEFFAATRQFDRAEEAFETVVANSSLAQSHPITWSKAVYLSLAIAVRVKRDPAEAAKLVKTVLDLQVAPLFVQQDAKVWKQSIERWKREIPRKPETEAGLYVELLRLMGQAQKLQKYPADRSALVEYLRASTVAHDLLQVAPQGRHSGDALLIAGACYEVLQPIGLEDLPELYYEACIRREPHSAISRKCFGRYERTVYLDYTGSAGTDLPEDVKARISELRNLAQKIPTERN